MLKKIIIFAAILFMFQLLSISAQDTVEIKKVIKTDTALIADDSTHVKEYFVAYYFHGDKRCMTCKKLESFSEEAFTAGFQKELEDSILIWRTVNYDKKDNKHFIDDYQLYTKALVLSRIKDGKEMEWKNLDKIWQKVGNQEDYIKYVQSETRKFIAGESDNE